MLVRRFVSLVIAVVCLAGCGGLGHSYVPSPANMSNNFDAAAPSSTMNTLSTSSSQQLTTSAVKAQPAPPPVPVPAITYYTGSPWTDQLCSKYPSYGYLQVAYEGRNAGDTRIVAHGSNLGSVRSVTTSAPGYRVSLTSVSATAITLDVRATLSEGTRPVARFPWTLTYGTNSGYSPTASFSVIPTLAVDTLTWGQCTWYAGGIARIMRGQAPVMAYSQGTDLNANPNSAGFPTTGSVLMSRSQKTTTKHMAYLESIRLAGQTSNRDGSVTYTWSLAGSQYNLYCDGNRYPFSATMITQRSKAGAYSMVQAPYVAHTIDAVAH